MQKLIILPGWGGTKETWQTFTDLAQRDFDVQVINLPCFGDEPCPNEVWGVKEYSNFVKQKLANLHTCTPVHLLGHSFGGHVAAYFTAQNPEMIDKLILFAPALFRQRRGLRRLLFGTAAKVGKLIFKLPFIEKFDVWAKKLLYKAADSPDYNETSGIKREIFKKIIRQDLTEYLPKISAPTLLVQGDFDKYVPKKDSERAAKLIPNAKLEIVRFGRHGMHFQLPEILFKIINKFLNGNAA
ncbi:alpha/beta hydrolase [Candidatus Peregrinibacteria bacterium]|nr:alpha/beta hydrolase [Candidatus Peregrinibacteria bacterium]